MKLYLFSTLLFIYAVEIYSCQEALQHIKQCDADKFLIAFNKIPKNQRTDKLYTELLLASKDSWKQNSLNAVYAHAKLEGQKSEHDYGIAFFASLFGFGITGLFGWVGYKSYLNSFNLVKSQKFHFPNISITAFGTSTIICTTASLITFYQTISAVIYAINYRDNLKKESEKKTHKSRQSDKIHTLLDDTLNPNETRTNWLNNQPISYTFPPEWYFSHGKWYHKVEGQTK